MAWFKSYSNDISNPKIAELIEKHGVQGYFFRERLFKLLAANFNLNMPGLFEFSERFFFSNFVGHRMVRSKKACFRILDFLQQEMGEVNYSMNGKGQIIIESEEMEKRADAYTKEAKRRLEAEREREAS